MHRSSASVEFRRRLLSAAAGLAVVGSMAFVAAAPVAAASLVVTDPLDQLVDDAQCSLREAIESANTDTAVGGCAAGSGADTITFDPAVTSITLNGELTISSDITLGGPATVSVSGNDTFRLVSVTAGTSTLRDLALSDGNSDGHGGAILVGAGASLTIQRLTVSSSSAFAYGGGAMAFGALTIIDSTFSNNTAGSGGAAGVGAPGASLSISGSTFTGNSAFGGGAINVTGGSLSVTGSTISGNSASGAGGGVQCSCSAFTMTSSTVSTNTAAAGGGGIYLDAVSDVLGTISRSTIDNNTSDVEGGGIETFSPLTVVNSTIWNNTATTKGGAIWRNDGLTLVQATIARNDANAVSGGGGVFSDDGAPAMVLRNSAISGNTNGESAVNLPPVVPSPVATNSLIGLAGKTIDDIIDPLGLQQNGGPTKTVLPTNNPENPLLGGGDTTVCTTAPVSAKDQRGFGRTSPCDIGAVELDRTKPVASGAKASLRRGVALAGSGMRVRLTWSASDVDSGIDHYVVRRSVNGGAYATIGSPTTKSFDTNVSSGTSYRFRITPVDKEGNVGTSSSTATFTARLVQQSASSVSYRGTWSTTSSSVFSGGSARKSSSSGASVTYSGTGRSFAFVSTVGPGRGKAKVYVDGVLRETIDLGGPSPSVFRSQVWSRTFSGSATHRVKIVVVGTSGRPRVDADAFAVLR